MRLLEGLDFERPTILRVRALTRLGAVRTAKDAVVNAAMHDAGDAERAEMNTLYAALAVQLRRDDVPTAFEDAALYVDAIRSCTLGAELSLVRAQHAWLLGDRRAAEAYAARAARDGNDDGTAIPHLGHVRALAKSFLATLAEKDARFDLAAARWREALAAHDTAPLADAWVAGHSTAFLALLARDFPGAATPSFLEERIVRVWWGASITAQLSVALHGLGWARAHDGDDAAALRAFREAAARAPCAALRVMALIDHANLARQCYPGPVAEECVRSAADAADELSWQHVDGEQRSVLLFAAEMMAPLAPRFARVLLKRFRTMRPSGPASSDGADPRYRCFEMRAEAAVLAAQGAVDRASALYRAELEGWREAGSGPRAAIAAADLYALTRDAADLDAARKAVLLIPRSWIARRIARLEHGASTGATPGLTFQSIL